MSSGVRSLKNTEKISEAAAESAGMINAKHCEEYLKKLAFADSDPSVRAVAREAYDKMKTPLF